MEQAAAPLEGVVVVVIDAADTARQLELALGQAGATTFFARDDDGLRELMERISPHFAVVDPTFSGGGSESIAWKLFSHPDCRTIIYSAGVHPPAGVATNWLIDKSRPVSEVVAAIGVSLKDSSWPAKGGDDVKPAR